MTPGKQTLTPDMESNGPPQQLLKILAVARRVVADVGADAVILLTEQPLDWQQVSSELAGCRLLVAAHDGEFLSGITQAGLAAVRLDDAEVPTPERLRLALLEAVADDQLKADARVVALYSAFQPDTIDSLSVIDLGEHLERLTASDLRRLETQVPLETLKLVVDLALEIGREGREGKPIGTIFVVGDTRKVLHLSHPLIFDPFRGYSRKERNIRDRRVRESLKEIAQMDGAIVISSDGVVEAAGRYLDAPATGITLSKGLGSRHWAAAAASKVSRAIAVVVSESTGTVRIFQDGEVMLRIEPLRRPMKWHEFEYEAPPD